MLRLILIAALLGLSACATLTGVRATDCPAATTAMIQAQAASAVAASIAARNPQSQNMQDAALLAALVLATATATQSAACQPTGGANA